MIEKMIKHMRTKSGLNQAQLAERVGMKQNTISEYETGTRSPSYDMVALIADECDFDIAFIDRHSGEHVCLDNTETE